jgi:hypothetical protein
MSPLFDRPPIDAISVSNALFSSGTFRITGGPGITVGTDASGATINAGPATMSYFDNMVQIGAGAGSVQPLVTPAVAFGSLLVQPLSPANEMFPGVMSVSTIMMQLSVNHTSNLAAATSTARIGIYTRNNATQLGLFNSASTTWAMGASVTASVQGLRWLTMNSSLFSSAPNFTNNVRYYYALVINSAGAAGSASYVGQNHLGSQQRSGTLGAASQTAASLQHFPMMGVYSSTTNAMPATIPAASIIGNNSLSPLIPFVGFNNVTSAF